MEEAPGASAQGAPDQEASAAEIASAQPEEPTSPATPTDMETQTTTSPKPPSLRTSFDGSSPNMTASSAPLGPLNAARRPGPPPSRASGLTSDIQAKMKAFSLSRQGAPSLRPGVPGRQGLSPTNSSSGPIGSLPGGVPSSMATSSSPGGPMAGGFANMRMPPGINRPQAPNWNSAPSVTGPTPRMPNARPGMGGLAAKRGLKPGGMKLSDATGPPTAATPAQSTDSGTQFSEFANIIDTKTGTLNFANKAVIHGGGIDFSSGSSFSISLDEVDTIDELGKGNYGTVYKVRHARPRMRRPGLGLRGNMPRASSNSISSVSSDDSTASAPPATGTGLVMAMKEIRLELDNAKFAAIIMELDILHKCISPFIIDFYGAFFQEGAVYICMEHMDGGSIDKLYGDGIPEGVLRKITLSTVMGLKSLKDEHNIIHRDVKPTNILVNTKGQVKICDFGVSGNLVASIAKTNIGCQSYMAPERISGGGIAQAGANPGGGTYSVQSDIWSLGLSIIECAMGRYPYPPETYDNIFSQLSAIVDGDPPDLPPESYSEAARDFVRGCLNKIPKLRPTYAMLLRHGWLAPLMKPPTIAEDEEAEAAAEAGQDSANGPVPVTADKEVADWVKAAIERKLSGKMAKSDKPALHAAPLNAVPGSPLLSRDDLNGIVEEESHIVPGEGVKVQSPDLEIQKVESMDFAGGAKSSAGLADSKEVDEARQAAF